jgi:hypothetical protein
VRDVRARAAGLCAEDLAQFVAPGEPGQRLVRLQDGRLAAAARPGEHGDRREGDGALAQRAEGGQMQRGDGGGPQRALGGRHFARTGLQRLVVTLAFFGGDVHDRTVGSGRRAEPLRLTGPPPNERRPAIGSGTAGGPAPHARCEREAGGGLLDG